MQADLLIDARAVSHHYGAGPTHRQILFDIDLKVEPGAIVILTGPSGSGKTTLLTLIGGLRAAQAGSLRVLGEELRGASQRQLSLVRQRIGYIFQSYNLLSALTAARNVEMALTLDRRLSRREARRQAAAALDAVGLGHRVDHLPHQLSGGEKQRVAVARALVREPGLILADEPTAALDRKSGREVVEIMRRLAKERGAALVMVTHDNRILDLADRIVGLEDGRLSSFTTAVTANTRQMIEMLTDYVRKGELTRQLDAMTPAQFSGLLEHLTMEFQQFLRVNQIGSRAAFDTMLEKVIEAFTIKAGQLLQAERVSLFMVDRVRNELWSKVAQSQSQAPLEIRIPLDAGIAGRVARSGVAVNVADAYQEPDFDPAVDRRPDTGPGACCACQSGVMAARCSPWPSCLTSKAAGASITPMSSASVSSSIKLACCWKAGPASRRRRDNSPPVRPYGGRLGAACLLRTPLAACPRISQARPSVR